MKKSLIFLLIFMFTGLVACEQKKYFVTFETNEGDIIDKQELKKIDYNSDVIPTKQNYDFVSWYFDAQLSQPFKAINEIEEDLKLFAKWRLKEFSDEDLVDLFMRAYLNHQEAKVFEVNTSGEVKTNVTLTEVKQQIKAIKQRTNDIYYQLTASRSTFVNIMYELYGPKDNFEYSSGTVNSKLEIDKVNSSELISYNQYMADGTITQATGAEPGSDYITDTQLKFGVFITENKLNVFVESELDISGTKFTIGDLLGGVMGFMIKATIPADFLPIYEIILPMITDHRESITIEYNQEKYYEAVGIIMMAKSFLLNLEMEQAINQELWPVSIADGILTVDNIGLFSINNPEFAMILPILEMALGTMDLSPIVQTILNSTLDVTLSTEDNKFSELRFDFNGIDLEISLNTKDVVLPVIPNLEDIMDPDNPDKVLTPGFEEVESLTIVDTIIELIGYFITPELPPVEETQP